MLRARLGWSCDAAAGNARRRTSAGPGLRLHPSGGIKTRDLSAGPYRVNWAQTVPGECRQQRRDWETGVRKCSAELWFVVFLFRARVAGFVGGLRFSSPDSRLQTARMDATGGRLSGNEARLHCCSGHPTPCLDLPTSHHCRSCLQMISGTWKRHPLFGVLAGVARV